ncbi:sirohydrochlorin cobaltochelatase [Methylacidimicrobium cyclopophantes]|uniref:Sirohydrochlorin cobaltochelatase n=1 Tax=Methylacidimicrobium cyclopophantes TaxID=1041766 RepID=A0A5E6M8D5_9BACT|nr:CbiX/SirB N-terminal domain-containing protein [Methylacidimicrobium cyclopophantes]VVM05193.1 sirohydrochlorin cobaltochelatase [Methylacidimicrobium cyclopophantes]
MKPRRKNLEGRGLILAGHGSMFSPESALPIYRHAASLRACGAFAAVYECFWKEEPSYRNILHVVEEACVYLVPDFLSHGYFTREIVPREFGLVGPVTRRGSCEIRYCEPPGRHPRMAEAIAEQAAKTLGEIPSCGVALLLVGHGTDRNENSAQTAWEQAERIRASGRFAECSVAFLEQEPSVARWRELIASRDLAVVPFFLSEGKHSYVDIPRMMGLARQPRDPDFRNPQTTEKGRRVYYAGAAGMAPIVDQVILAQVDAFDEAHRMG